MATNQEKINYHCKQLEHHKDMIEKYGTMINDETRYCNSCFDKLSKDNPEHNLCFGCWDMG